ncbi:MAG: hypothetical protein GXP33_03195 [Spirochaetes bacterium]|nr:hypothetical protein [Spirochaetota bacterium]
MSNLLSTWKRIIFNPKDGYKSITEETKIFMPVVIILIISIVSISIMLPIITSKTYLKASIGIQIHKMEKKGTTLNEQQLESMNKYSNSKISKIIAIAGSYLGGIVGYLLIFVIGAFVLLILSRIFRCKDISYRLILRIIVFTAIITAVQGLIKIVIVYFSDWQAALKTARTMSDLKNALAANLSAAAFFDPKSMNRVLFYLIDYFTDIFNIIYFVFIFYGLSAAGKIKENSALAITIVYAVLASLPGFGAILFI